MKKILASILASAMVFSLSACGSSAPAESSNAAPAASTAPAASAAPADESGSPSTVAGGGKIGVSMPTQSLQRWNQDGTNMKAELEAAGYEVDLQYAGDNDIPTQVSQLENMISSGCNALVVASIDGSALTEVLKGAKDAGIPVIAYDRLIMNSDAVSYYATFDNYKVGTIQGNYIKDALDLDNAEGPFNIELFTGAPDDNNVNFFFGGAMDVLNPYIESGKLVVLSGQTEKAQCATPNWSAEESQKRMEKPNVKNIVAGYQDMSVFKDTRTLASQVVKMVDAVMQGSEPEINDTETYDNGTGVIPSYLCDPVVCTVDNYKELLIDSGYYTEADID